MLTDITYPSFEGSPRSVPANRSSDWALDNSASLRPKKAPGIYDQVFWAHTGTMVLARIDWGSLAA
jgi:hypothetical protein